MRKRILQRTIVILLVTLAGLYIVIGPRSQAALRSYFAGGFQQTLAGNINLGLDLRGGSQLVMKVQVDKYLNDLTRNTALAVQQAAQEVNLPIGEVRPEVGNNTYRIVVQTPDPARFEQVSDDLANRADIDLNVWSVDTSGNTVTYELTRNAQRALSDQAVAQAENIVRSRIDAVGVTEPTLQRYGAPTAYQLLLQMPGVQDPERVKELLGKQSNLQLAAVVSPPNPAQIATYATEAEAVQSLGGSVPANRRVLPFVERNDDSLADNQPAPQRYVIVENPPVVQGSELRSAAAVSQSGSDDYQVTFNLKPGGAAKFGTWTGSNIGRYLAVVLDDRVASAPYIRGQITDQGQIDGRFTRASAEDLALTLRSGALPAPIVYQEERTVGPSLGADSIRAGVRASVAGLLFVIVFMVIYYKGAGINAIVALLLNMLLTLAALVIFGATLTLPGIAGLILSIGMAVDSNVLIFERIREELRAGKTVPTAVDQGFARAFVTIIDTHVTTIVSSLFLYIFGSISIRGFAVTLILGLLINLFSAVYVSRTIFMWLINRRSQAGRRVESLSI